MTVSLLFRPGTGPLSLWVIFMLARTVPPSFVDHGPKLRVLIQAIGHWPDITKNKDEPWKITHTSEMEIFLGVDPMGKL